NSSSSSAVGGRSDSPSRCGPAPRSSEAMTTDSVQHRFCDLARFSRASWRLFGLPRDLGAALERCGGFSETEAGTLRARLSLEAHLSTLAGLRDEARASW